MEEFIIAGSSGNFSINGTKYYRSPVRVKPLGESVTILSADGSILARGSYSQFRNGNNENATFGNVDELLDYFDTVFSSGGGGGEGATNIVLTQQEYDAIIPDPNTTYDIIE